MKYIYFFIIFTFIYCSTTKEQYTYEVCVEKESEESEIIKNELIGIADTTIAYLSGQIVNKETKAPLTYSAVTLTSERTGGTFGRSTDTNGMYSIRVPADEYKLQIDYVGYSALWSELKLGTGEIRKIDAALGEAGAFVNYEIKSDKKLNRLQLNKRIRALKRRK